MCSNSTSSRGILPIEVETAVSGTVIYSKPDSIKTTWYDHGMLRFYDGNVTTMGM